MEKTKRILFGLAILLMVSSFFCGTLRWWIFIPAILMLMYIKGFRFSTIVFLCTFGLIIQMMELYLMVSFYHTPKNPTLYYVVTLSVLLVGFLAFILPTKLDATLNQRVTMQAPPETISAGFWRRFLAAVIDGFILGITGAVILAIVGLIMVAYVVLLLHKDFSGVWPIFIGTTSGQPALVILMLVGFMFGAVGTIAGANNFFMALAYLVGLSLASHEQPIGTWVAIVAIVLINIVCWIYCILMESSRYQGTVGKLIMKLSVIDQNGQRLSIAKAFSRYVIKFLSFTPICLGYLYIGMSPNKQALHDVLTKCFVVKKPPT